MLRDYLIALIAVASLIASASDVRAFGVKTHRDMSGRAANLCSRLTMSLQQHSREFPAGLNQKVGGRVIRDLIGDGSVDEDSPFWRTRHHFHDPTRNWDAAGLTWGPGGMSSILWQQNTSQGLFGIGDYGWSEAREHYGRALTDGTKSSRDQQWAKMFLTLGHLIHLIQDAGAPSHTRNDDHLPGDDDAFHTRADDAGEVMILGIDEGDLVSLDSAVLMQPANDFAPLPIARFIDATDGTRPVPDWGTDVGIAEYSNGKFFSDDRLFSSYAHPAPASLESCDQTCDPTTQTCTGYLCFRAGQGETDYKVGRASALTTYLVPGSQPAEPPLDNAVLDDYGRKLFPRAIGYSVGLIDYFFRTVVNANGSPVLRLTATDLGTGSGTLRVANTSSEDMVDGALEVFYDDRASGLRVSAGSVAALSIAAGTEVTIAEGGGIDFGVLRANSAITGAVVVVYRGRIGAEADAVSARACDCPATPTADTNDLAYDCRGLCPCEYVGLEEGDVAGEPGVPGDGVTVPVSLFTYQVPVFDEDGNFIGFEWRSDSYVTLDRSVSAVSQRQYPNGFTVTVFAAPGAPAPRRPYVVEFLRRDEAFTNGVDTENPKGNTSVSGAAGSFVSVSRPAIDDLNAGMSPTDPFYYDLVANIDICQMCSHQPVDAVALCPGLGMSPPD